MFFDGVLEGFMAFQVSFFVFLCCFSFSGGWGGKEAIWEVDFLLIGFCALFG